MDKAGRDPLWRVFLLIWGGQSISVLGSRLTSFALSVQIFRSTGSVTLFGLAVLGFTLPGVLVAPFAGALVDRRGQRWGMLWSNAGAALATLAAVLLLLGHRLEPWHLCLILAANSLCDSLQQPAFFSAITLLVDKRRLGRANGMIQLGQAGARIVAPALAGVLIEKAGLPTVLLVDLATFLVALGILLLVRLPAVPRVPGEGAKPSLLREVLASWRYLRERAGLVQLAAFSAAGGFVLSMLEVLMLPFLLTFGSAAAAGVVSSAVGLGMLLGSLGMSAWGGPRRLMRGMFFFSLVEGAALMLAGWRADLALVAAAFFLLAASLPISDSCGQILWQNKTPVSLQGRVFAFRRFAVQVVSPLGILLAGPLADRVFEPALLPGGALAASAGRLLGTGPGRGLAMLLVLMGAALVALVAIALSSSRLRRLEDEVPDAVAGWSEESEAAARPC